MERGEEFTPLAPDQIIMPGCDCRLPSESHAESALDHELPFLASPGGEPGPRPAKKASSKATDRMPWGDPCSNSRAPMLERSLLPLRQLD